MIHNPKIYNTCTNAWCRPTDWNQVPYIAPTDQIIYIQFAVFNDDSNYFACLCSGAYSVDTGDGVVTNVASNTKFEYKLEYSAYTKVCNRGYKVATIKIYPQAGQNLTRFNFQQQHSLLSANKHSNILEIVGNLPSCSTINNDLGGNSVSHSMLENINLKMGNITSTVGLCYNCGLIRNINLTSTSTITVFTTYLTNTSAVNIVEMNGTITGSLNSSFNTATFRQVLLTGNLSGVTSMTSTFATAGNLSRLILQGLKLTFTVANQKLSATALNELFTSLGTPATTQTVTVTGNPGAATCDTTIATAKNWTVVIA